MRNNVVRKRTYFIRCRAIRILWWKKDRLWGGREGVAASSNLRCVIMKSQSYRRLVDTWVLTIYKKPPGGDLVHKHIIKPAIKFDMMGERPVTKCIRITWVDWKEKNNGIALNHSRCFPKTERGKSFDSPTGFPVSHVNGNYPWMLSPPQKSIV